MFLSPYVAMVSSTMHLMHDIVDWLQEVYCNNRFDLPFWCWNGNIPGELGQVLACDVLTSCVTYGPFY